MQAIPSEAGSTVKLHHLGFELRAAEKRVTSIEYLNSFCKSLHPIKEKWNFLRRDAVIRPYVPMRDDPYLFGTLSDYNFIIAAFHEFQKFTADLPSEPLSLDKSIQRGQQLIEGERDVNGKLIMQRGMRHGWYLNDFSAKRRKLPSAWVANESDLIEFLVDNLKRFKGFSTDELLGDDEDLEFAEDLGEPMTTNSGYPYYETDKPGFAGTTKAKGILFMKDPFLKYDPTKIAILDHIRKWSFADPMYRHPFAVAANRRYGPSNKFLEVWNFENNVLTHDHLTKGIPNVRQVYMACASYNIILSVVSRCTRTLRRCTTGMYHSTELRNNYMSKLKGKFVVESDFSQYDKSVSIELRQFFERLALACLKQVYQDKDQYLALKSLRALEAAPYLPYVMPDPNDQIGVGFGIIADGVWGLFSGIKVTSDIGTVISWCTTAFALSITTQTPLKTLLKQLQKGDDYVLLANGDDILVGFSPAKWRLYGKKFYNALPIIYDQFGLKGKVLNGSRFLMRHLPDDSPVWSRIWQQTFANEKKITSLPQFFIGLWSRTREVKRIDGIISSSNTSTRSALSLWRAKSVALFGITLSHLAIVKKVKNAGSFFKNPSLYDRLLKGQLTTFTELDQALDLTHTSVVKFTQLLAESGELADLARDAHNIPSAQFMLETILKENPGLINALKAESLKEAHFFKWAVKEYKIDFVLNK
jgi:hypothetical protein